MCCQEKYPSQIIHQEVFTFVNTSYLDIEFDSCDGVLKYFILKSAKEIYELSI